MKLFFRQGGLWLLLFFCWLPAAVAQISSPDKVAAVVITNIGPRVASDELVRANIHIKPGDPYIRNSIDQDVINLYKTGFFQDIRVLEGRSTEGVTVTYLLQGKFRLTGITFEGNTKFSDAKLRKKLTSRVGDPLDERKLFNDELEIQKMYEKSGYQHTTVKYVIGNYDYAAGYASVTFQIQETPKIKIVEVDFTGAHAFPLKKLRKVIKTRRHWMFSWLTRSGVFKEDQFEDDKDKLADFYRQAGYIDFEIKDVKFTYPTPRKMKIEFVISEGQLYKVGSVTFSGNKLFTTDQIAAGIHKQHEINHSKIKLGAHALEDDVGMTFTPGGLDHDITAIEDFYGAKGYINVRQEGGGLRVIKTPNTETGTMDLEYDIAEGEKVYIERILIKGNVKTKDKVIRRELAVSPGEVFDMVKIKLSQKRLEGLGFFADGKVDTKPEPNPDVPDHDDLIVGVEEKSTGTFTFGAGFNTVTSIFGTAEIAQANFDLFNPPYFTGAGQKFRMRVELGTEFQDYLISFVEPWFLNRKLRLQVDLYRSVINYISLDNLYNITRTGARAGVTRALGSDFLIGGLNYDIEQVGIVDVNTNAPNTIVNEAGFKLENRLGASISYDTRNDVELPNKGQFTSLEGTISVGDRNYWKTELKTGWYFRGIGPGDVLELGVKGGVTEALSGGDVPFYDRFYLGGPDSLRGFDYTGVGPRERTQDGQFFEPIGGDTYWFGSAEYSVPIMPPRLRFAVFYDIGNVAARPWSNKGTDVIGINNFPPISNIPPGNPIQNSGIQGNTGAYSDDFGFGIRLNIPTLGPLRLDYGIPIHHDNFNGPSGKIQFSVGFSRPL